jgi:hypothetical protein
MTDFRTLHAELPRFFKDLSEAIVAAETAAAPVRETTELVEKDLLVLGRRHALHRRALPVPSHRFNLLEDLP